jgi:hypothetical protein
MKFIIVQKIEGFKGKGWKGQSIDVRPPEERHVAMH